jgi:hypothetical protein
MLRRICVLLFAISLAASANAASLSVSSDKLTYTVGETVTLSISGDPQGVTVYGIFGRLLYNGALVNNGTRSQITLTGPQGNWIKGVLQQGDTNAFSPTSAFSYAFNQIAGLYAQTATNLPANNPLSTVTLIASATGLVNVVWDVSPPYELMFFGLTNAPGTSFTIVPEPATAALLGAGLCIMAAKRRTR